MYHCGAEVKELLERADQPGSTSVDAVFCFFVSFLVSFFLTLFFFLAFFSLFCWPCWSWTSINIYFKLKSGVLFWKRDFKSSWSAYWPSLRPDKNRKQSRHVPPQKQQNFSTVCGVLCVCFLWCQRTLIWEINFVTSKQFFSAIDAGLKLVGLYLSWIQKYIWGKLA